MKWILVVVVIASGRPAIDHIDGFKTRKDCLLTSEEMRLSLKDQTRFVQVLTYCMKVEK